MAAPIWFLAWLVGLFLTIQRLLEQDETTRKGSTILKFLSLSKRHKLGLSHVAADCSEISPSYISAAASHRKKKSSGCC